MIMIDNQPFCFRDNVFIVKISSLASSFRDHGTATY